MTHSSSKIKNQKFLQRRRRSKASTRRENVQRHRKAVIALNLALTRNALLAIIPYGTHVPLSSWFENYQRHQAKAVQLIDYAAPVQSHFMPNALDSTLQSISNPIMNHYLELKATNGKSTPS